MAALTQPPRLPHPEPHQTPSWAERRSGPDQGESDIFTNPSLTWRRSARTSSSDTSKGMSRQRPPRAKTWSFCPLRYLYSRKSRYRLNPSRPCGGSAPSVLRTLRLRQPVAFPCKLSWGRCTTLEFAQQLRAKIPPCDHRRSTKQEAEVSYPRLASHSLPARGIPPAQRAVRPVVLLRNRAAVVAEILDQIPASRARRIGAGSCR